MPDDAQCLQGGEPMTAKEHVSNAIAAAAINGDAETVLMLSKALKVLTQAELMVRDFEHHVTECTGGFGGDDTIH